MELQEIYNGIKCTGEGRGQQDDNREGGSGEDDQALQDHFGVLTSKREMKRNTRGCPENKI